MRSILPIDSESSAEAMSASPGKASASRKRRLRLVLATVLIVVALTGFFVAAYSFHFLGLGAPDCASHPTSALNSAYFVVLLDNRGMNVGMNGSKVHSGPWPVMNVTLGESVTIHVWNVDPVEAHGFAITRYFPPSLTLNSGQCHDVTFIADQLTTSTRPFRVYCWIQCSIHNLMINGLLNVNPGS